MKKIQFVNNSEPYINGENLNTLQNNVEEAIDEANKTPIRKALFIDSANTGSQILLNDSIYNYSYIYVESTSATYNAMIPIYSNSQTGFRGIGGFASDTNVGSTHIQGTISDEGKTLTVAYFKSVVHTSSSNHSASTDRNITKVFGIR